MKLETGNWKLDWDQEKNQSNFKKHGVDFEETKNVFDDIFALIIDDRFHSNSEQREIIIGQSSENRLLYIVFIQTGNCIRIISARKLTSAERKRYEQGKFD